MDVKKDDSADIKKEVVMFREYKTLPRKIRAVQFTDKNKNQVYNSLTGQHAADFENGKPILKVKTVHGDIAIVRLGDWIVEDAEIGTYYPIKDELFRSQIEGYARRCPGSTGDEKGEH